MAAQTSSFYRYSTALQASVLWGSWSYYRNSNTSVSAGIKSGIAQGLASFFLTLSVVFLVTKFFNYVQSPLLKLAAPTLLTVSILMVFLAMLHTAVGTPETIKTITPPLSVAILFCAFTTYKLNRENSGTSG